MSFDPFETRLHFLQLLRKLNASQASIHKVVSFAMKFGPRCGEDLWECVVEECAKVAFLPPLLFVVALLINLMFGMGCRDH